VLFYNLIIFSTDSTHWDWAKIKSMPNNFEKQKHDKLLVKVTLPSQLKHYIVDEVMNVAASSCQNLTLF